MAQWALDMVGGTPERFHAPKDMLERIVTLEKLPPLPEIAQRILALKADPLASAGQLAAIVELDPALTAQVLRWASSPIYGLRGKVVTVKDAIAVVLGFDQVFNLAFGLCTLGSLQAPVEGLLGKRFFWQETLAGSLLMHKLARLLDPARRPEASTLHLAYLLHNIGHLLLSHLFRKEFDYLVQIADANPQSSLFPMERFALGIDHGQLGAWLVQSWNLPIELQTVTLHHHNPFYQGEHETLVLLTCLTDRLLGQIGIGDACNTSIEETPLLERLGLDESKLAECLQELGEKRDQLEGTLAQLL